MTSKQIAEVTGKRHCEVLRAIRNMEPAWEKITLRKFAYKLKITEIGNGALRETPYYELTKTECLYIATKFNDEARARLILRWEQLENERLTAPQEPQKAEILPPVDNQVVSQRLVEVVDGKAVTTSRKLAEVLGRKHDSILETIKSNLHKREFKYGHFTARDYSTGACGHGYEFLITRKGLDALASVMRRNAREKLSEAYAVAWGAAPNVPAVHDPRDETIRRMAAQIADLQATLEGTRHDLRMWGGMYEAERRARRRDLEVAGRYYDYYEDLLKRVLRRDPLERICPEHQAFRKRITHDERLQGLEL